MSVRIVHLADVHWRGMSRHDEYRESFESFFDQVRELAPDLIYVGGDIVHSKTQGISPELIDCLVWWFRGLADLAPTHVILGNHDGIVHNQDRQDAISPIINAINHPRITLYKNSGRYPTGVPGFNWCVFSCFDKERWPRVKPRRGQINIALFHGSVVNSLTDTNWKIEGDVEISFFDKFDFTFLGDIHRQQFLTDDKTVAYCGSTIQQNYGESLGKGFLFWSIRSKDDFDVEFYEIPHSKPFVTVDWVGSISKTMEVAQSYPKGARFRVKVEEPVSQMEIIQLQKELSVIMDATEVVIYDRCLPDISAITVLNENLQKSDFRDPETHVRLLQTYLSDADLSVEDWELIEEMVRRYVWTVFKDNQVQWGQKWSVRRMEFSNTFTYGKDNVINFEKLDGITGIFGRNRRGKSSVIGSLVYCLFNTTDRGPINNIHVINTRKDYCKATVDFSVAGEDFRVERQSVRQKHRSGKESSITHLNFWQLDDKGNTAVDLSGENRRQTEKIIRHRIGLAEDFLLTSLASQGEMNIFIKERATARKATLTRFLGLDIFEHMLRLVKEEAAVLKAQLKTSPDRDWSSQICRLKEEKRILQEKAQQIDRILMEKREILQNRKIALSDFTDTDVVTPADVDRQSRTLMNLQAQLQETQEELENLIDAKTTCQEKINQINDLKSKIDVESFRSQLVEISELEDNLKDLKRDYEIELARLKRQRLSVQILNEVPCGDRYPTCKFIRNSYRDRERIDDQVNRVESLFQRIKTIEVSLRKFKKSELEDRIRKFDSLVEKGNSLHMELSDKQVKISSVRSTLVVLQHQIERATEILRDLQLRAMDNEDIVKLSDLKREIDDIEVEIAELDAQRITIANQIGRIENNIEVLQTERDSFKDLCRKWKIYEYLMQAMSNRGIPLQIIQSQLPVINSEIAKILNGVVSFKVELQADSHSNTMDIYIDYGDSRRIIEMASGMEKIFASLAIRVALINISSLPKTDMLIIDEGFGGLDELNVEACNRLLLSLKKWFRKILIITHVDGVKDVVDNVIDITWNGKDAKIVYE